jgi:hypothetical protein
VHLVGIIHQKEYLSFKIKRYFLSEVTDHTTEGFGGVSSAVIRSYPVEYTK